MATTRVFLGSSFVNKKALNIIPIIFPKMMPTLINPTSVFDKPPKYSEISIVELAIIPWSIWPAQPVKRMVKYIKYTILFV